ncbi:MAG: glycoside hydrolase family 127 protein [Verrucomicrobia bacterium]|nr:glycoside hydrolase family 127 protein [Verrucomicrobiota bacterium]
MKRIANSLLGFLPVVLLSSFAAAAPIEPLPFKAPAKLPDAAEALSPSAIHIDGWLGARLLVNEKNRLLAVDTEPLLAGFRQKPGTHPWIGEHVGKWLHAATLAWAYTGDAALREKLDRVAAELIQAQEPDGYLGTYVPEKRFGLFQGADWDVWSHKYNLIGLLTYHQFTGNEAALKACRKIGDLLIATFPARKSILSAGTHVGMAATSVLEPVVVLHRLTGDPRYLDFALYLVKSWDEPNGPKIIEALMTAKQVNKTANAKAYEMLSNLVGLCELARATGDRKFLEPVLNAWQDIVDKRLYLTGSASQGEHFRADFELPNQTSAHVAETCVTTTWIQLNLQLLRLTGEARFANELEKTIYNHLAAAQHPRGDDWCYFTALEGKKPYDKGINCCHSSGPRGLALAPQAAYLRAGDTLLVSTFETSRATLDLGGQTVTVDQQSEFPRRGNSQITLRLPTSAKFGVKVRVPAWAAPLRLQVNGQTVQAANENGWALLPAREWKDGDRITLSFSLGAMVIAGQHGNEGRSALQWGPFVLAYDEAQNRGLASASAIGLADVAKPPFVLKTASPLTFEAKVRSRRSREVTPAVLVPFADAGADGGSYRVWLRAPGAEFAQTDSVLADGEESRSRQGNQSGSINDGDAETFVVTFNAQPASEDWFAVTLNAPATIRRVVFAHGKTFHDGGWFNAGSGKPRVEIRGKQGGPWQRVGELAGYPATTAVDNGKLKPGQKFELKLPQPASAVAVRVIGQPAGGDNPKQAFSSCAELEAFAE